MSEWPEHSAELGRKSMERLTAAVDRYQKNAIGLTTLSETIKLYLTADILSDVTQGLIDNETWNTIYAVRQEMAQIIKAIK